MGVAAAGTAAVEVGMAVVAGTVAADGTVVVAGMAAVSASRTSTIGTSSAAATIRTIMAATIPITITHTAGWFGPIGVRAVSAVIATGTVTTAGIGGTIGIVGTGIIGKPLSPEIEKVKWIRHPDGCLIFLGAVAIGSVR